MVKAADLKYLAIIITTAFVYSFGLIFFTGVPARYQLNSDAEVHLVHWREFSSNDRISLVNDAMFKLDIRPKGELFIDKIIVKIGEFLGINILSWSVIISYISLLIFLSGVYFVVSRSLNNRLVGFLVGLGSVIPAFSLGGSSWGLPANGFLPRDLALGLAVWLFGLYLFGIKNRSIWNIRLMFLVMGLLANWYPLLFFHFSLALILADIIRLKSLKLDHILYGLIFCTGAIFAISDIVSKSLNFTAINMEAFRGRFSYLLLESWEYAFFRYLRRFILYLMAVIAIYFAGRKYFSRDSLSLLKPWHSLWLSSAVLSLLGLYLENYTSFARFFISRLSVWFIFSSMVIVAYSIWLAADHRSNMDYKIPAIFAALIIFLGQSMIPTAYRHARDLRANSESYLKEMATIEKLKEITALGDLIFMNPDRAGKIRTYGARGTYVSWKDGNIAVLDGVGALEWSRRLKEADESFNSGSFAKIAAFGRANNIKYFLYNEDEIIGEEEIKKYNIFELKPYAVAKIIP